MRTLIALEELAITYKELGTMHMESNKGLARQYLENAYRHAIFVVEQCKEQLGDKQPHTWMAQGTLGRIKAAMGDVDEAERLFSSLLPVTTRHLRDHHLGVLSHKNHHSNFSFSRKAIAKQNPSSWISRGQLSNKTATFTDDNPDRWDAL